MLTECMICFLWAWRMSMSCMWLVWSSASSSSSSESNVLARRCVHSAVRSINITGVRGPHHTRVTVRCSHSGALTRSVLVGRDLTTSFPFICPSVGLRSVPYSPLRLSFLKPLFLVSASRPFLWPPVAP